MSDLTKLFDDVKKFLPKYLSEEDIAQLFSELKAFPENLDKGQMYTQRLKDERIIFQGDGLRGFTVVDIQGEKFYKNKSVIIFSNTCDIDTNNNRLYPSNICYAPLLGLEQYKEQLLKNGKALLSVEEHINAIKKQKITQILYLPKEYTNNAGGPSQDCIVFLDQINHCHSSTIERDDLPNKRIFSLSNYGFYLFLIKISIHFTRIQEKVSR